METVFQATLALEAHLVRDLLERAGIPSHIEGEYLQGAAGELPLGGLARVCVAPDRASEAREIIAEWERQQPADSLPPARRQRSWAPFTLFLGAVAGFLTAWIHFNTPVTQQGVDYDDDGKLEEQYFYDGQKIAALEYDRNSDGHMDLRYQYDSHGVVKDALIDDNFDQRFESRMQLARGQPSVTESDRDGDGFAEEISRFSNGVLSAEEFLSPTSHAVLKRLHFTAGRPSRAEFDADGDGTFERHIEYDEKGDPKP